MTYNLGHWSLGHLTKHKIENLISSFLELPKCRDFKSNNQTRLVLDFDKGRKEAYCTVPTISFEVLVQHIRISLQKLPKNNAWKHLSFHCFVTNSHEFGFSPIILATKVISTLYDTYSKYVSEGCLAKLQGSALAQGYWVRWWILMHAWSLSADR